MSEKRGSFKGVPVKGSGQRNSISKQKSELKASSGDNAVTVCVRIRPPNPKEIAASMRSCFEPSEEGDAVMEIDEEYSGPPKTWHYDHVFGPACDNEFVFNRTAKHLVTNALDGYNTVLFMYGQTSSGKTFTLFGGGGIAGLVDHSLREVYECAMNSQDTEYVIKMNFVELYNEELKDLLTDEPKGPLGIVDDPDLGPLIQNITEVNFTSVDSMRRQLDEGDQRRHFGVTNMNAHSSRSHVMVRLNIESRKVTAPPESPLRQSWGKDKPTCFSTLNLVDLAGSERANKSGTSGQSLKEGSFINKSLLTLGTVISNLSQGKTRHVPYRDSKLTRLLQSALGGNAKTCMITCVSPASGNLAESHSTLRFASRAKQIVNHVKKNEFDDAKSLAQKLLMKQQEVEQLRAELEQGGGGGGVFKEKALSAQRKFRTLKFLVMNSAQVVKSLTKAGKVDLAKQVRDDVRCALEGSRSLEDVLEEHNELLTTHLGNEQTLLRKMSHITRANSVEAVVDDDDMDSICESEAVTEYMDDFQNDEYMEQIECALMMTEDVVVRYENKIHKLLLEQQVVASHERRYRQSTEDLNKKLSDANDDLKNVRDELTAIKHKHDRFTKKAKEESNSSKLEIDNLTKHTQNLEALLKEKEKIIEDYLQEIAEKDTTTTEQKQQIEKLEKDLHTANTMRLNFENEAKRTRNELRTQMDRLRSNMHNMLEQGDQESKVLEMQNSLLFNDLKTAQDECDSLKRIKSQVEEEMKYLRKELLSTQENSKAAMAESKELRQQCTKAQQTAQVLHIDNAKLLAKLEVSEGEAERLRARVTEELANYTKELDELKKELKSEQAKFRAELEDKETELTMTKAEVERAEVLLEAKQTAYVKLEQQGHFEILKLEKKISAQMKSLEDITQEHIQIQKNLRDRIKDLTEDKKALNRKITEQEIWVDSVNTFLQEHEEERDGQERTYTDVYDTEDDGYASAISSPKRVPFTTDITEESDDENDSLNIEYENGRPRSDSNSSNTPKRSVNGRVVPSVIPSPKQGQVSISSPRKNSIVLSTLNESSARFKLVKLGLRTCTRAMQYVFEEEMIQQQERLSALHKMGGRLDSKISEVHRTAAELEAARELTEHIRQNLRESHERERVLEEQISDLEAKLREMQREKSEMLSSEDCTKTKFIQLEFERSSLRAQLVKAKADLEELMLENRHLESVVADLNERLDAKTEENIMLISDLDLAEQRNSVVVAERDELVLQFIKGGRHVVDENGVETLYTD